MPPKISLVPAPTAAADDEDLPMVLPPLKMRKAVPAPAPAPAQVAELPVPVVKKTTTRKPKLSPPRQDTDGAPAPASDLTTLLEQKGYQVLAKVLDGGSVRALKVTNVYGEWVLLWLDKKPWQSMGADAQDVLWHASPGQVGIPDAAKTGYSATVDPTASGVAIEQGPDLSVLLREGLESVPTETTYLLAGASGKSIVAYPVLRVSDLLQSPDLAAKSVHTNTLALQMYARRLAEAGVVSALQKVRKVVAQLDAYHKTEGTVLKRMDATYRQLVEWYDAYQTMEQTEDTQKKQALVAANIRVRQDAMRRLLRASQTWSSDKTQSFLQDLETKLEEDVRYLTGVEKGIDYIMTE